MGYDARNLMTRHRYPDSSTVYFEYDANANITGRVYPDATGTPGTAGTAYDSRNRQTKLQSPSGQTAYFAYNRANQPVRRLLANGAEQLAAYDAAGRMTDWTHTDSAGAELPSFHYTRDPKGLPTKAVRDANHTIYYSYDADDRLTKELWTTTDASPSEVYAFAYAYDAAGNRLKARRNGVDTYYEYNAGNQLTKSGDDALFANATNYAYDLNGSLIRQHEPDGTTYFRYNPAGLAERVVWKDDSITRFYYDANLQRYAMDEHGTLTYFLWDGLDILQERAANGTVTAEHTNAETPIPGIGQLVETHHPAAAVGERKLYPIMDPRGTIEQWLQDDGETALANRTYDAFGEIISETGTWPSRFGYQGQAWMEIASADGEQRLGLSPTRIYDFENGLFSQRDRVQFDSVLYNYVHYKLTVTVDPYGLFDVEQGAFRWKEVEDSDPLWWKAMTRPWPSCPDIIEGVEFGWNDRIRIHIVKTVPLPAELEFYEFKLPLYFKILRSLGLVSSKISNPLTDPAIDEAGDGKGLLTKRVRHVTTYREITKSCIEGCNEGEWIEIDYGMGPQKTKTRFIETSQYWGRRLPEGHWNPPLENMASITGTSTG